MPGLPNIAQGEGLIRSHDLFRAMEADIDDAVDKLATDPKSQFLRRCLVRAIFSYIEAVLECLKVELRATVRTFRLHEKLSEKEVEVLGHLGFFPTGEERFLPLDANLKRTFKLAAKVWSIPFRLATAGEEFQAFLAAKNARNRLTHPRTFYDIEVTASDLGNHTRTAEWIRKEFHRLMQMRVRDLERQISEEMQENMSGS